MATELYSNTYQESHHHTVGVVSGDATDVGICNEGDVHVENVQYRNHKC